MALFVIARRWIRQLIIKHLSKKSVFTDKQKELIKQLYEKGVIAVIRKEEKLFQIIFPTITYNS